MVVRMSLKRPGRRWRKCWKNEEIKREDCQNARSSINEKSTKRLIGYHIIIASIQCKSSVKATWRPNNPWHTLRSTHSGAHLVVNNLFTSSQLRIQAVKGCSTESFSWANISPTKRQGIVVRNGFDEQRAIVLFPRTSLSNKYGRGSDLTMLWRTEH